MAVPKKRKSKSKKNSKKSTWKRRINKESKNAFSLAKSVLTEKKISFVLKAYLKN